MRNELLVLLTDKSWKIGGLEFEKLAPVSAFKWLETDFQQSLQTKLFAFWSVKAKL